MAASYRKPLRKQTNSELTESFKTYKTLGVISSFGSMLQNGQ